MGASESLMHSLLLVVFVGYSIATLAYLSLIFTQNIAVAKSGKALLILTFLVHTAFLLLRIKADHDFMHYWYAPVANIFEHVSSFSWGLVLVYLIAETRTHFRALGIVVMPLVLALVGWAAFGLNQSITPPPPALQSYWINIHVPMSLGAYGAFTIAFALSIFYFIKKKNLETHATQTGLMTFVPDPDILDKMMYKTVIVGFGFLTALIMLGAVWAEESWGKYWSWDPKETAALITWLVYAIYLHGRFTWGAGKKNTMAILCMVGFLAVIFTYLGVGFLLPGLHSYLKS